MKNQKAIQLVVVAAVVLLFVLLIGLVANLMEVGALTRRRDRLNNEIIRLESQIEQNNAVIAYKNSDFYIEQYARENLNMKKVNEIIFR